MSTRPAPSLRSKYIVSGFIFPTMAYVLNHSERFPINAADSAWIHYRSFPPQRASDKSPALLAPGGEVQTGPANACQIPDRATILDWSGREKQLHTEWQVMILRKQNIASPTVCRCTHP